MNLYFVFFYRRYDIKGNLCAIPLDLHAVCWRWLSRWLASRAAVMTAAAPATNQQDAPASAPQNVFVPALSADENSLVLVWEKPESETEQVVDYAVYRQGQRLGQARENQNHFSPAKPILITSISGSPATAGSRKSICAALRPPTCSRIRSMPLRSAQSMPMAKSPRIAR